MQIEHQFPKGKLQNQNTDILSITAALNSIRLNIAMGMENMIICNLHTHHQ